MKSVDCHQHRTKLRALSAGLGAALLAAALVLPSVALADVQSRFAGNGAGNWSQNEIPTGPSDGTCNNLGAINENNDVFDFNFDIPSGETIVGVVVKPDHAQPNDEDVRIQLLGPAGLLGNAVTETWPDSGSGNCDSSFYGAYGSPTDLSYWGLATLAPATVNSSDFGVRFVKATNGSTKVDAVCIDVYFSDGTGVSSCESTVNTGTLTIVKNTTSSNATFDFSVDTTPATTPSITTTGGTGSTDVLNLEPRLYAVSEIIPAGWDLVSASCDDGTSEALGEQENGTATVTNINLNPGQTITCTFVDSPEAQVTGSITVIKQVQGPTPDNDWGFTGDLGGFDLDAAGGSRTFSDLGADTYTITETTQDNYTVSVSCGDDEPEETNTVDVTLVEVEGEVENITCTFINAADPGSLTVIKELDDGSNAPGSDWQFGGSFSFTLPAGGGTKDDFEDLVAGQSYTITELAKPGYSVEASCEDEEGEIASGTNSVGFTVEPGQEITCTFINTEQELSITIIKDVEGDEPDSDWNFSWTGGDDFSLDPAGGNITLTPQGPGDYTITEDTKENYEVRVSCNGGEETQTNSVTVNVQAGVPVECTFVNEFQPPPPPPPPPAEPEPIPTLSQWALIALASLMALITLVNLRRRQG